MGVSGRVLTLAHTRSWKKGGALHIADTCWCCSCHSCGACDVSASVHYQTSWYRSDPPGRCRWDGSKKIYKCLARLSFSLDRQGTCLKNWEYLSKLNSSHFKSSVKSWYRMWHGGSSAVGRSWWANIYDDALALPEAAADQHGNDTPRRVRLRECAEYVTKLVMHVRADKILHPHRSFIRTKDVNGPVPM
jgi:hypothetical protein